MAKQNNTRTAAGEGSVFSYTVGFIFSIILTLLAYAIVVNGWLPDWVVVIVMILAALQMVIQLVFFLHLGRESKPRWNLAVFYLMLIMIFIIVIGSLWIMDNLNYNMMMTPEEMDQYMLKEGQKGF